MGFARRKLAPALVVAALTTFLVLRTFVDPRTPVLLGGDQGFFWMYADRMLRGELPYRDFFQFTLPGADLVHVAAFALFGARVWVTDALVVVLGAALATVSLIVARRIMSDGAAALASSVLVVLVFGQALTTTHHWWSTLFVLAAVATLDEGKKDRQWALAGVLLGLAIFCTQSHGGAALVAFVVFAYARKVQVVRRILLVVGSSAATLLGLMAYFVATVGLHAVWRCTGAYVMSTMASTSSGGGLGLPEALTSRSLPALLPHLVVYAMLPIAYVILPRVKAAREGSSTVRVRRLLLWVVGSILALEVLSSLSWVRVFGVAWPAVILVVAWIDARAASRRLGVALAWLGVVGLAFGLVRSTHRHHASRVHLPGEQVVAVDESTAVELAWLVEHVVPQGSLFATNRVSLYLPLGVHDPIYLDAAVPSPQTTIDLASRAATELDARQTEYVLWSLNDEEASQDASEGMEGFRAFATYVHGHYQRVSAFASGDEVWQRAP